MPWWSSSRCTRVRFSRSIRPFDASVTIDALAETDRRVKCSGTAEGHVWGRDTPSFGRTLALAERTLLQELRAGRHKWAHQECPSMHDVDRALDSMACLKITVSAFTQ